MKKSIIAAGAASLALAALPVVSTFAITYVYDTINVTISDDACTFNRVAGEGTYNAAILPGNFAENFGSSTFAATCNDTATGGAYNVTASFTQLTDGENTIDYSPNAVSGSTSSWRATVGDLSATSTALNQNDSLFADSLEAGKTEVKVWYSVGAAEGQANGTYTGYAIYTLAEN